ncbi:oxygenase MpaB family protein [Speluncibacter jeojiensis]|uniref:oxygenase MpaB family protein n=1 Tax=Speluncibacter jeojiensis TaxID=2710754 RepID=UPI002410006C|nr:oxygenase MpaB family protein [Rhodococcus sp. D2-41]
MAINLPAIGASTEKSGHGRHEKLPSAAADLCSAAPGTVDLGSVDIGSVDIGSVDIGDFIGESFLFLGAGSTVLLQLAFPGVGHGVADHSSTLHRPMDRLRTTMTYVYAVTLGTPDERRAIVRMVNKAHVPVHSEPDGSGTTVPYNAFDPQLQLWVAATLYKNGATLYERFFGPLDDASAERLYQQSAVYGTALQVKPDQWPATREEFEAYWQHTLDTLEVDDKVRRYVHALLHGGDSPWIVRLGLPLNRFVTTGLLPQRVRDELELPWGPRDQRRFDRLMTTLPKAYRLVPRRVRWLPSSYYLWDMRRRLRGGRHLI